MKGLERYKKIKDIGEGAQGNVILSWDTLLERNVAIKSLHKSLTSDTLHVKRFKEEAKTLASLGHPCIIGVYEYIANSSGCHLVMEYFEGHPLDLYIRNVTGPIPEERVIDIYTKVLDAMSHIHKKKIIHRDIKPSNIMINDKSEIRLLDFGIAKNTENDPTLTKIGSSAGYTPMYMSPEHCNGEPITKYSDIYSLGVTLWQMLTGKPPYEGFTQGQIYLKVAKEPLQSIQSVYPEVSLKMNTIVQNATQKKPKKRYPSCDAFKKELVQLKKHIKDIPTVFIFNLKVKIANGIDATIYLDEEQHYGTEFSKSFDVSDDVPISIKIEKPGYKKIQQQLFLKKNEVINFNIEKQTDPFSSLLKLKNNIFYYLKNIPANLSKVLIYIKLTILWAIESVQFKLNKNSPEVSKLYNNKRIETRKNITESVENIKPHKKEYISYSIILSLIVLAIFRFNTQKETPPLIIPTVNFETLKTEIVESQSYAKILVVLSKPSESVVKIPIKYTGSATIKNDYTTKSDTVIIEANQKLGFIELDIINDKMKEQDETILIELQNPENATLGEQTKYSYTILNDDKSKRPPRKHPKKGTKYKVRCNGTDLYQYYHDGKGGHYKGSLKKRNSTKCGYTPPKVDPRTFYQEIINREDPNYYTEKFGDYFIIWNEVSKRIKFKVYSVSKKRLLFEKSFKGRIRDLYYRNKQIFTNKKPDITRLHHFIDIKNPNESILKGLKALKYQGKGDERKIKKIRK